MPALPPEPAQRRPPPATGDQLSLPAIGGGSDDDAKDNDAPPPTRNRWAWLLAHVFRADLETCPLCGGPMRWLETALAKPAIDGRLAQHGLGPGPPLPVHRLLPGQLALPFAR